MRVGIVCLYHESNSFVKSPTKLEDFERHLLLTGPTAREQFTWVHHEVRGFFDELSEAGIEAVPLMIAAAQPGGIIEVAAMDALLRRLQQELSSAGPLDGILAAPHGAAVSEQFADVDGHWLGMLRKHLGKDAPIIATFDPHANISQQMVDATDALIGYRTNPHLDQYAGGREAAKLMVRTLRREVRPAQAAALPPVVINIEKQLSSEPPCRDLYAAADAMLARPGVLSNSVVLGFRYADVPKMGSGFVVV